jgi:RNA-directed DNA polymerase
MSEEASVMDVEQRAGRKVEGVRDTTTQDRPATVPQAATQAGEIHARWAWVEATVWNERMLTALEVGVKGGKWFSLIDKVYALPNLRAAFARVKANAGAQGVDRQTIEMFEAHLEANLHKLAEELRAGTYQPRPVRRTWIDKPGKRHAKRPLGIPTIRDRVVQTAMRNVIEPIFENDFATQS